jgi:hypothetical protein
LKEKKLWLRRLDLNQRRFGRESLKYESEYHASIPLGRGQWAFGINSVSLKKGYWEKESASDAQQSTCEFRLLLRRQTLYPAELRAHSEGNADFRAFLDHSQKNPII